MAFSILAFSLGILFQIYSRGSNVTALSHDYSQALIVAQSQLAILDLEKKLTLGVEAGETGHGIKWQRQIGIYEDEADTDSSPNPSYRLVNVQVDVSWQTLGRPYQFSLKSLRLTGIER